jgi:S1-C subfamily serine protease
MMKQSPQFVQHKFRSWRVFFLETMLNFQLPKHQAASIFATTKEALMEIASDILSSVCGRITVTKVDGSTASGTGFLFCDQFFILTCEHVIHGFQSIQIQFHAHGNASMECNVISSDSDMDLAILKIVCPAGTPERHPLPFLKCSTSANTGIVAFVGGYPGDKFHFTDGIVASSNYPDKLVLTNLSNAGTSGGPCVGKKCRNLIGMVKEDFGQVHHRTTIIPYVIIYQFVRSVPGCPEWEVDN